MPSATSVISCPLTYTPSLVVVDSQTRRFRKYCAHAARQSRRRRSRARATRCRCAHPAVQWACARPPCGRRRSQRCTTSVTVSGRDDRRSRPFEMAPPARRPHFADERMGARFRLVRSRSLRDVPWGTRRSTIECAADFRRARRAANSALGGQATQRNTDCGTFNRRARLKSLGSGRHPRSDRGGCCLHAGPRHRRASARPGNP